MNDATALEVGLRRTVSAGVDEVWEYFVVDGITTWLGNTTLGIHKGDEYLTADGIAGAVLSRTDQLRLRITWQPDDWDHDSTLQVTLMPADSGTTIGFHHEGLASAEERSRMLAHWSSVLDEIVDDLS